jgi:hypothetical protein
MGYPRISEVPLQTVANLFLFSFAQVVYFVGFVGACIKLWNPIPSTKGGGL